MSVQIFPPVIPQIFAFLTYKFIMVHERKKLDFNKSKNLCHVKTLRKRQDSGRRILESTYLIKDCYSKYIKSF